MSSAYERIIELRGVSFSYSEAAFIEDLSMGAGEAAFIGLLGANGSGKSTMLKLLAGILRPQKGEANLWGKPVGSYKNKDRAKLLSYLPQVLDMNVPFRVKELARMGLYPYDTKPPLAVDDALGMVGLLDKKDSLLTNLSGGERRRAFIAMTLLQGAGILLLDEPLANLDIRYQMEIIRLLKELNRLKGITIIMALHDINLAMQFEELILVKEGRLLRIGPPDEVLTEDLLKEAFGIEIKIERHEDYRFISYGL
ncbi:MAG: ABC transporter ATP-binding protein [Thermodesulfovibrionales bacterium]|nr:ABC transporter ATP-binding protein [Thermodesulfovibrionales bacterium]